MRGRVSLWFQRAPGRVFCSVRSCPGLCTRAGDGSPRGATPHAGGSRPLRHAVAVAAWFIRGVMVGGSWCGSGAGAARSRGWAGGRVLKHGVSVTTTSRLQHTLNGYSHKMNFMVQMVEDTNVWSSPADTS
ncbi:uncharacterized protein AAGF69_001972 isoform 1-T1 [Amazona ochrocephala]